MSTEDTNGLENFLNEAAAKVGSEQAEATTENVRKNNEVFTDPSKSPLSPISREQYVKQELGFEIPIDAVPLPSKGKLYPLEHPLHNAESVEYRAMTAREEDILMSTALIKKGTVITELIRSCLVDKNIDVRTLLSGDQQAIMMAIRISGYGRLYEPQFQCPECKTPNQIQIDLADFEIKGLEIDPVEEGRNLFKFELPVTRKTVHFKFLTVAEEEKAVRDAEIRKKKKLGATNNLVTSQLLNSIVAVDGHQSQGYVAKFIQNMPARDSMELRRHIQKNQPSVATKFDFLCDNPDCEHYEHAEMPMTLEFFWPGSRDA
jgi:hypothetical protein